MDRKVSIAYIDLSKAAIDEGYKFSTTETFFLFVNDRIASTFCLARFFGDVTYQKNGARIVVSACGMLNAGDAIRRMYLGERECRLAEHESPRLLLARVAATCTIRSRCWLRASWMFASSLLCRKVRKRAPDRRDMRNSRNNYPSRETTTFLAKQLPFLQKQPINSQNSRKN